MPVLYEEEIVFSLGVDREVAFPSVPIALLARDTTPDGVPRFVIGTPPRDSTAAATFTDADFRAAQLAVLRTLAEESQRGKAGQSITVCVQLLVGGASVPADAAALGVLTAPGRRAVAPADCPRTYTSMICCAKDQPPGWIDPFRLSITRSQPWIRDVIFIEAERRQGTGTNRYSCEAHRQDGDWLGSCDPSKTRYSVN